MACFQKTKRPAKIQMLKWRVLAIQKFRQIAHIWIVSVDMARFDKSKLIKNPAKIQTI